MPFQIIRQDITKMEVDAIVNSTNTEPIVGGTTDYQIHQAAGPMLIEERKRYGFLKIADAVITGGYLLPAKHVIHTVGPIYMGGTAGEDILLKDTYLNCLNLADSYHLQSVAFPLISSGTFGYPKDQALDIALDAIRTFLKDHEMMVYLVVFDDQSFEISKTRVQKVESYLHRHFVDEKKTQSAKYSYHPKLTQADFMEMDIHPKRKIEDVIDQLDETFTLKLFRFIREKRLDETEVYKRANMSRQHFSKIRSDDNYKPKKETVMGLSIAMRLSLDETRDLLESAGYALSSSIKSDMIVQYHIVHRIYDLYEINAMLYHYHQKLIGLDS